MSTLPILERLKGMDDAIRAMGATAMFAYGSQVHGDAGPQSDLDLFIEYRKDMAFDLFDLMQIKNFLEDRLAMPVDLTTRGGLHPRLKDRIEASAIQVF
jgi:uncharacterized protein